MSDILRRIPDEVINTLGKKDLLILLQGKSSLLHTLKIPEFSDMFFMQKRGLFIGVSDVSI